MNPSKLSSASNARLLHFWKHQVVHIKISDCADLRDMTTFPSYTTCSLRACICCVVQGWWRTEAILIPKLDLEKIEAMEWFWNNFCCQACPKLNVWLESPQIHPITSMVEMMVLCSNESRSQQCSGRSVPQDEDNIECDCWESPCSSIRNVPYGLTRQQGRQSVQVMLSRDSGGSHCVCYPRGIEIACVVNTWYICVCQPETMGDHVSDGEAI